MAAPRGTMPMQEDPYEFCDVPPQEVINQWIEVGNGIEKSQTVVWKSAVDSLTETQKYLRTAEPARVFCETYMSQIISILVEQQPSKIGPHERQCVQDSLALAVVIVAQDLDIQIHRKGECKLLHVLAMVFDKKKAYYKGAKQNWNVNHTMGFPEFRIKMIDRFRQENGFGLLHQYMVERINTPIFPDLKAFYYVLMAIADAVPGRTAPEAEKQPAAIQMEDDAIAVANDVMEYIKNANSSGLKELVPDPIQHIVTVLRKIFDRLISSRRKNTYEFYDFWRGLILRVIMSQSLPLKLFGWEQLNDIIIASKEHAPPPSGFTVTNAGCKFVNGDYLFRGEVTEDGYALRGHEITYVREIPQGEEGAGKKLTLFRCTMRSQQKWWFLSEADEEQPGTDRDIDYYQHKSKEHEEMEPPPSGWVTCRNSGVEPPPILHSQGLLVPKGEERNTLEHQLAKWAIENKIIEMVLGDSAHREVVARSTALIKFLAMMAGKVEKYPIEGAESNAYCLRSSHLLLAWKTCIRGTDTAVSTQVYQLLVSILPTCPSSLAIPFLQRVQQSLDEGDEKKDYLTEVGEFCAALAAANPADSKPGTVLMLQEDVRAEVLTLLWKVLTHPDANTLKSYDNLKRYVTHELRVEPKGKEHREKFLASCVETLSASAAKREGASLDEIQALRMVKLTRFVLEACPREQSHIIVTDNNAALPGLLFSELTAFLERKRNDTDGRSFQKVRAVPVLSGKMESNSNGVELMPVLANSSQAQDFGDASVALPERLRILRYAYGLSDRIVMSSSQLHELWNLCVQPNDREELMVFIASASKSSENIMGNDDVPPPANNHAAPSRQDDMLSAAFTDEVCSEVFLNLFCSPNLSYNEFGESGYNSFQIMFSRVRSSPQARSAALDALWRICLTAGISTVASKAMNELLNVYRTIGATENAPSNAWTQRQQKTEPVLADDNLNFGERLFDCLTKVKTSLNGSQEGAERSAERCLRIMNAAIGQTSSVGGNSATFSTLARLSALPVESSVDTVMKVIPHGMRGQASLRKVGIMVKRQLMHTPGAQNSYVSGAQNQQKNGTSMRFTIDVHPLETLLSVKFKVAAHCQCNVAAVKAVSVGGRNMNNAGRGPAGDSSSTWNTIPDDSVVDELGIVQGQELIFSVLERPVQNQLTANKNKYNRNRDLSDIFFDDDGRFADKLFTTLLEVLEALPWREPDITMGDTRSEEIDSHKLVWDVLLAMPTDPSIDTKIRSIIKVRDSPVGGADAMDVDTPKEQWSNLLDMQNYHRSVYVLLALDAFLQPSPEVLSSLPMEQRNILIRSMEDGAASFRRAFVESGGFDAVVHFFAESEKNTSFNSSRKRLGNAVALRVLKCCLFGNSSSPRLPMDGPASNSPDELGSRLLQSLSDAEGLLKSLTSMVVGDAGISTSTVNDVLKFLRLLLRSPSTAQIFVALPGGISEQFLVALLMWEGGPESQLSTSALNASAKVRKSIHDIILQTPQLADHVLPWLIRAIDRIEITSDATYECFDVLNILVSGDKATARSRNASDNELQYLATTVCKKVASCPRPTNENAVMDSSTGVLCGCLQLLQALIESRGGTVIQEGTNFLVKEVGLTRWSESTSPKGPSKGMLASLTSTFSGSSLSVEDRALIDLMGAIFDGYLSPGGSTSVVAICSDKQSRERGFDIVSAAARSCSGGDGYLALVSRIEVLVESAAPFVRHKWGQVGATNEGHNRNGRNTSKYSGLRNQGCTCYMNSFLQQMFMTPELRKSMCQAPLPTSLRSTGGVISAKGHELVGKKLSMQWESGANYDANVISFDKKTGMHTIQYLAVPVATVSGSGQNDQFRANEIAQLPDVLPDEFFLSEGRPGKETGVFEIVKDPPALTNSGDISSEAEMITNIEEVEEEEPGKIKENPDEKSSRRLLEEVQRTFIHLDEGSRGRCFDPRALVEACYCLKLEFDVWQQNDAAEFAIKLLDRLEIGMKLWAPSHFRYMDHTFGIKQTKQKICKECGLRTNREEKMLNIDCQVRGITDIHEALDNVTQVEVMEGENKVSCDNCKKKTDTVLRTAISHLPNMMILSLKRFDLDFTTFETVKLNSRCAFGQTLNMKRYTLEAMEAMEQAGYDNDQNSVVPMDTSTGATANDPLSKLPDEDYEYKLAGVLVHAGVAQGGHYYSFIKDRHTGTKDQWYRFDDEDVTPFDPALIEQECFGGKTKKETKWPNGQVHTQEQEQYANALMLFYEKVKPTKVPEPIEKEEDQTRPKLKPEEVSTGVDVFEPDVRRSNATHRWQTFLFDPHFQNFLKGLLGLCQVPVTAEGVPNSAVTSQGTWRAAVVQTLLGFFFDIMLYASNRPHLNEWVNLVERQFALDLHSATAFVQRLASKTYQVSQNWLRTYLMDCPDQQSRNAAVRIFSAAIRSCMKLKEEQEKLYKWAIAWKEQLNLFGTAPTALPLTLGGPTNPLEDPSAFGTSATPVGCIISFLNVLIDSLPRAWRYNPDLGCLLRNLAAFDSDSGGTKMRKAMAQAMVPARLAALVVSDRSPDPMRLAFPGASVSRETAQTQMRQESSTVAHVMPMGGNHVMNTTDMNSRGHGNPSPMDYLSLFEAIGCLAHMRGSILHPLLVETDEATRGRSRLVLNKQFKDALTTIFHESCAAGAPGMGQREIDLYLNRCGVDSASVPQQKLMDLMAKYPVTDSGNGSKSNYFSLDGFLAYYEDIAQNSSQDAKIRNDLHTFGYRPDFCRRKLDSIFFRDRDNKEQLYDAAQSVAIDTAAYMPEPRSLGPLFEYARESYQLFYMAYNANDTLAEHLVAALCVHHEECEKLIFSTLENMYFAQSGWGGNEIVDSGTMILKVLASIPDQYQQKRLQCIMLCEERPSQAEHGAGLLPTAHHFHDSRPSQPYSTEVHYTYERCVNITKELLKITSVAQWMRQNHDVWRFMERDLTQQRHGSHRRGSYNARDAAIDHHQHSDSEMVGIANESEDEDDEFGDMENQYQDVPAQIIVEGAGQPAVNGVYARDGWFEQNCRYSRQGKYKGQPCTFSLFQCNVSNNTKHWYISIVPRNSQPGTSTDIDFYSAPVLDGCVEYPPAGTWTKSNEGIDPPPKLRFDLSESPQVVEDDPPQPNTFV